MTALLLIDDDKELCTLLADWLAQEGFTVQACHDMASAKAALAESRPQAVLLDVMLPDGSGLQLLKQLRREYADLPLLMLSARGEPLDRILGLELGADDYLPKPCDPRELSARLRAVLRRSQQPQAQQALELGDLSLDVRRGVAIVGEQHIALTLSESKILETLLKQAGEPLEKQRLAQLALGRKLTLYDRSLDMHVSNLRRKIGAHADGEPRIRALRGRGYYYAAFTQDLPTPDGN